MRSGSPIETLAAAFHRAMLIDLPEIDEKDLVVGDKLIRKGGKRRPSPYDVEVFMFPQTWGSTALGFGGLGGASMTTADTVVVQCDNSFAVYFGGGFAYVLTLDKGEDFEKVRKCIRDQNFPAVYDCGKFFGFDEVKRPKRG